MVQIDGFEPADLAKLLQIAADQKRRALKKLGEDFGFDSAGYTEAAAQVAKVDTAINDLVKAQAAIPLRRAK